MDFNWRLNGDFWPFVVLPCPLQPPHFQTLFYLINMYLTGSHLRLFIYILMATILVASPSLTSSSVIATWLSSLHQQLSLLIFLSTSGLRILHTLAWALSFAPLFQKSNLESLDSILSSWHFTRMFCSNLCTSDFLLWPWFVLEAPEEVKSLWSGRANKLYPPQKSGARGVCGRK